MEEEIEEEHSKAEEREVEVEELSEETLTLELRPSIKNYVVP